MYVHTSFKIKFIYIKHRFGILIVTVSILIIAKLIKKLKSVNKSLYHKYIREMSFQY